MIEAEHAGNTERTVGDLLAEIKDEAFEFLQTRALMLISDVHENMAYSKKAVIYGVLASMGNDPSTARVV